MTKQLLLSLLVVFPFFIKTHGQIVLFQENFDGTSNSMTSTSEKNNNNWALTTSYSVSGTKADSATVGIADTTYLTSPAFSTTGNNIVYLDFDQIAKVEFFDACVIEVSNDNGANWTRLTSVQYLGSGQFGIIGNKFNSASYTIWAAANGNAIPTSAWWQHESFNLSTLLGNISQAKIRFSIIDENNTGAVGNYGWLLDNIKVWSPAQQEASIVDYNLPFGLPSGCGLTNETVKIRIANNGSTAISSNLTASFKREGIASTTENVPLVIAPLDTITYTFTNKINLNTTSDTVYNVKFWVSLLNDPTQSNDTIYDIIASKVALADPIVSDTTIVYGGSVQLKALHADSITWSSDPLGANIIHFGSKFTTPTLFDTTTYYAQGGLNKGGAFFMTEVAHYKTTTGAPVGGWPSYLSADDYIEITGLPGSDLAGYTLEQWSASAMDNTYTFPSGTVLSPNGTAIIAVGQASSSSPSPSNYYYHGNIVKTYSSTTAAGRILKSPTGVIVDAVAYGNYPFPAASGVTVLDWKGRTPSVSGSGNRLIGAYTKDSTNWVSSSTTYPQNPNTLNGGVTLPTPSGCPSRVMPVKVNISNIPNYNAGITSVNSPVGLVTNPINNPLSVTLKNYAGTNLTKVTINYILNDTLRTPYIWTGNLGYNDTVQVAVANINLIPGINRITAWTSLPNDSVDGYKLNDTSYSEAYLCLSGTFTIGGTGANFQSVKEAADVLNIAGVCGPAVFNINAGTYSGAVELNSVVGVSATNTITFKSTTGDSTQVIITDAVGTPFSINSTSYITIQNLKIANQAAATSSAIAIANNSSFVIIKNCLLSNTSSTTSTSRVISVATNLNSNIVIDNNKIVGGYTGIYLYGSSSTLGKNNVISNNDISGFYYYGAYAYYQDSVMIRNNNIHDNETTTGIVYGLYPTYCFNGYEITGNNISISAGTTAYGIREYYCNYYSTYTPSMLPGLIANNFISILGGTTTYGLNTYYSSATLIANNSVNVLAGATNSYALHQTNTTSTVTGQSFYNNNLANNYGGYAAYYATVAKVVANNYNNYFTVGTNLAYWSAAKTNLSALQSASGMDQNSISFNPNYLSNTDLHISNSNLNGVATPLALVTTDIDGDQRDPSNPDIGADEINLISRDLYLFSMVSPTTICQGSTQNFSVEVKNFGIDTIHTFNINWKVNGVAQTQFAFNGTVIPGQSTVVSLGSITLPSVSSFNFVFYCSNPNNNTDQNHSNDTLILNNYSSALAAGTYIIGPDATDDWSTFGDAVTALQAGICGNVVIKVKPGTYNEQITIPYVAGASANSTITFESYNGDSTSAVLTSSLVTLKLSESQYVIFDGITISTTGTANVRAVEFLLGASHNIFKNCVLTAATSSTSTSRVIQDGTGNEDYNSFENNIISGGYYAMYIYGTSSSNWEKGVVIKNNIVSNFYLYGIYTYYTDSTQIIGNKVFGNNNTYGYGIYTYYTNNGYQIVGNQVNLTSTSSTGSNGIRDYYNNYASYNPTPTNYGLIANNMITVSGGTASNYGIYTYYSGYTQVFNNSIRMNGGGSSAAAIYQYNTTTNTVGQSFYNNNLGMFGDGYAAYYSTTALVAANDYNNYFTTNTKIAYWGASKSTLADLRLANGKDSNSVSVDPKFYSSANLHSYSSELNNKGLALNNLTTDFDGQPRSATTPDIGADEFNPPTEDIYLESILSPVTSGCGLGLTNIQARIINSGVADIQDTIFLKFSIDGGQNFTAENPVINIFAGDTVDYTFVSQANFNSLQDSIFNVWVVARSSNDGLSINDSINIMVVSHINPPVPVVNNTSIPYGTTANLSTTSTNTVRWFDSPNSITAIATGISFTSPILFADKWYWADNISTFGCTSAKDSALVTITGTPTGDLGISKIETNSGCGLTTNEVVTITIYNQGIGTITSGISASFRVGNGLWSTPETVSTSISALDTIQYSFLATANLFANVDTTFSVQAVVNLSSDPFQLNDTLKLTGIVSLYKPSNPVVVSPIQILYGTSTTLTANSSDSLVWYSSLTDTVPLSGGTYTTPFLYDTTTYYAQAMVLNSAASNNIALASSGGNICNPTGGGVMFDAKVFSQSIAIDSLELRFNVLGSKKVNIYYKPGTFLGYETDSMAWIFHDSVTVVTTAAGQLKSFAINPLLIPAGTEYAIYANYDANYASGANTYQNSEIEISTGAGLCGKFSGVNFPRTVSGKLFYKIMEFGCMSDRVALEVQTGTPPNIDAGMASIENPTPSTVSGVPIPLQVKIKNYGTDTLISADISFEYDGQLVSSTPWTGQILPGAISQVINLGNYTFAGGLHDVKFFVSNANGTNQGVNMNDTLAMQVTACLAGVYTLGDSISDYLTFADALTDLNASGVCGNVVFKVAPGVYNTQITFFPTVGTDINSRVIFESATGDSTDVVVEYNAPGATSNWTVRFDGADYFTLRNMTIKATNATYATAIEMINGANHNIVEACVIQSTGTASTNRGIYDNTTSNNFNTYRFNKIEGGYSGIYTYGISTSVHQKGTVIEGNDITGFYYNGIIAYYQDSIKIVNNKVYSNASTTGYIYGINANYIFNGFDISGNYVSINPGTYGYGLRVAYSNYYSYMPAGADKGTVTNNMVSITSGTTSYGIYSYYDNNVLYDFNTVNVANGGSTTNYGLYQYNTSSNIYGCSYRNNNFVNTSGSYAAYFSTVANVLNCDYNNYYTGGTTFVYWGGAKADLAALISSSGKNQHSLSVNPNFISPSDLHVTNVSLNGAALPLAHVQTDIEGDLRNSTSPDIGADEFDPISLDAAMISVLYPVSPATMGSNDVKVRIANFGNDTLFSTQINWTVNGITQTPFAWSGSLITNQFSDSITIGNYSFNSGISKIKTWVSAPNGLIDGNNSNDTTSANVLICSNPLKGVYSIGGATADFTDFSEAVLVLNNCGIDSLVVFNVNPGVYNEKIVINQIAGSSSINTITFQSATGDSTDVVLQYVPTSGLFPSTLTLNGSDYITFKQITINSNATGASNTILMTNGADHNVITNCIVTGPQNSTTSNRTIVVNGGGLNNYNRFNHSVIMGVYYSAYIYGTSTSSLAKGNSMTGNTISDFYYYGPYFYYQDSTIFRNNHVIDNGNGSTYYPATFGYCDNFLEVSGNNLELSPTSYTYGLRIYYCDANIAQQGRVFNNNISITTGTSTSYGMYIYYSSYQNIGFNNVNLTSGGTSSRAAYIYNGSNVRFANNNLVTTTNAYTIYYSGSALIYCNHNNYYTTSSKFGYASSSDIANFSAWKTTTGLDTNSLNVDPGYLSPTNLHVFNPMLNAKGIAFDNVLVDFDGETRSVTPDIGSDEFSVFSKDVAVLNITQPSQMYGQEGNTKTVTATIANLGSDTLTSVAVGYSYNNLPPVFDTWTGTLLPGTTATHSFATPFTILSGNNSLCAFATTPGDINLANDTSCITYNGIPVFNLTYTNDFDGINNGWFTSNTNWQLGTPAQTILDSAYSAPNAWMTGLTNNYSSNTTDLLYTPYFNFNGVDSAILSFYHRYKIESGDGGLIEYSTDGGQNWVNLGYLTDPASSNWYNTNNGGTHCFSGTSTTWKLSGYTLNFIDPISPFYGVLNLQFRFKFYSNASSENEGWLVDDFKIELPVLSNDAGITSIISPNVSAPMGSNTTVKVVVKNFGNNSLNQVPVQYSVGAGAVPEVINLASPLQPGDTVHYTFATQFVAPSSNFVICAQTNIAYDPYVSNNQACENITVTAAMLDAAIVDIIADSYAISTLHPNLMKVVIKNFGTNPLTTTQLQYKVASLPAVIETWSGNPLATGDTVHFTFSQTFISPVGAIIICSKTMLTNDANPTNDEFCKLMYPDAVIDRLESGFALHQNYPNPVINSTTITYEIPTAGRIRFELTDITGRIIENIEEYKMAGTHQIEVDSKGLMGGVYFYTVDFEGQRLTKQLIITK